MSWQQIIQLALVLGTGLTAGIFFAFSTFVMPALARRPDMEARATMQAINVTVMVPSVMGVFLGSGALCLLVLLHALLIDDTGWPTIALVAAAIHLVGCIGVTGAGNVPRNERLAKIPEDDPDPGPWRTYLVVWSRLNSVRTLAATIACALFAWGLR